MDNQFSADEWDQFSIVERIRRCHLMAVELRTLANAGDADAREQYIQLAEQWLDLAAEMQREFLTGDERMADAPQISALAPH